MPEFFPERTTILDERTYRIRLLGVNGANPTEQLGQGVTATRTGEGAYRLSFDVNPGTFIGWSCNFGAATPADLKGYTAVRDTYTAPSGSTDGYLDFVVYDSTFTAADLIANQYADIEVKFSTSSEVG
jgi:hypothetical protein